MNLIKILQWEIKRLKSKVSKLELDVFAEEPVISLSNNTDILTTDTLVVVSVNNTTKIITIASGSTVGTVKASINSTDESIQGYVYSDGNFAIINDGYILSATDILIVTSEDGEATVNYSIAVQA